MLKTRNKPYTKPLPNIYKNRTLEFKPNRKLKIGSKELWEYCNKKYDKNKTKENADEDPKKLRKKNAVSVTVKKLK